MLSAHQSTSTIPTLDITPLPVQPAISESVPDTQSILL